MRAPAFTDPLPIDAALPAIRRALGETTRLVLAAPPGAGKTTRVPLALLGEAWLADGKILLLEPRRIAARMAAERMARALGETVGGTVGLTTRIDRRVSNRTRIEVITDGLFARRILADPALEGVGAVLFDEFHERSLNIDLGLALALDAQGALAPDLRLVAMSATLDTGRVAAAIDAAVVASEGRGFPVETVYLGRTDERTGGRTGGRIEDQAARAVRRALAEQAGSVLVFLPGRGEIARTAERLENLPPGVAVAPLYGALSPAEQDAAVAPAPPGARKVVLATDIAESALTIEGVTAVVDAGLARIAEHEPGATGARLVTRRASRASVDQRRGRAGRTAPGVGYRLWDEAATRGLPPEPAPEILRADLSGLVLSLAEWGERDPRRLVWIDPPPEGRIAAARARLEALGALDETGAITARGRAVARLPLEPGLAAMVAGAATPGDKALAAEIALLVSERGLGGPSSDLRERLARLRRDGGARATALRAQAARWTRPAGRSGTQAGTRAAPASPVEDAGRVVAAGAPMQIARARPGAPGEYLLAGGQAARLDASDPLAREAWLAVADAAGAASGARILAAAPLSEADALALGNVQSTEVAVFDPADRSLKARRVRRLGAIVLSETPLPRHSGAAARAALAAALAEHGFGLLAAAPALREMQARLAFARRLGGEAEDAATGAGAWPDFSDAALATRAGEWLDPLLGDPPDLDRPGKEQLRASLEALLGWDRARALDALAPRTVKSPAGTALPVDYAAEGAPRIEARVQEFYGLDAHPAIGGGRVRLAVSLLSPARRQVALTQDLPGFWRGGYRDMAKDMRGRYPKHDWPDDPARARPHEGRTKARL